jgi:hypothetical protein
MRPPALSLAAGVLAIVVIIWQFPLIGVEPGQIWLSFIALAVAVLLLAAAQIRHRG